jgi:hypothetical protein
MRPWDNAKPEERNHEWCCSKCNFYTFSNYFEYEIPIIKCPQCGESVRKYRVYICSTCRMPQGGVEQYNWHTLNHWIDYKPLPKNVGDAIRKFYPSRIKE